MKPLARNVLAATGSDAGSRMLGFLVTAYLARVLGPSSFGLMSIGLSILGYAFLFSGPGLNVFGTRHVASSSTLEGIRAGEIVVLRVSLACLSTVLFAAGALAAFGFTRDWLTVALFIGAAVPMAASPEWFLQGKNAIGQLAVARLAMYVAYLGLVLLLVREPTDAPWSAVAFAGGATVMTAVTFMFMRTWEADRLRLISPGRAWVILRESLPLGGSSLLAQTIVNAPVLIVGAILTTKEAGLFGSAMKLVFFALMLDRVFYLLFLPVASRWASETEHFKLIVAIALKMVLFIAVPVTLFAMAFAGTLTSIVYGNGYAAAAPVVAAAMPYFGLTVVSTVMMTVLFATHQEKAYMVTLSYGTAVLVVLCAGLTLLMGTVGSGIALSLGELVMVIGLTRKVSVFLSLPLERILLSYLIAAGTTAVAFWLTGGWPLIAQLIVGIAVFIVSVPVVRGVTTADVHFLRQRLT